MGHTFEFWVSYLIAVILGFVQVFNKDFTFWPTFLSSVILILPGFSMTMGFMDVFARQTVVGLTTLFNAAWMALMIGVGAFMGLRSVSTLMRRPVTLHFPGEYTGSIAGPGKEWAQFLVYVVFSFFLNLSFQAKIYEAFLIIPLATAAFGISMACGRLLMLDETNYLLSCLFMGIIGHIYGKVTKRSEMPSIYSGVIVFAPGTYGARAAYYSLMALFESVSKNLDVKHALENLDVKHALYAVKQSSSMLTISASMAIGLLIARALFARF